MRKSVGQLDVGEEIDINVTVRVRVAAINKSATNDLIFVTYQLLGPVRNEFHVPYRGGRSYADAATDGEIV